MTRMKRTVLTGACFALAMAIGTADLRAQTDEEFEKVYPFIGNWDGQIGSPAQQDRGNCGGRLGDYGEKVGLAFQIVDDWLDVQGDEVAMGKRGRGGRGGAVADRLGCVLALRHALRQLQRDLWRRRRGGNTSHVVPALVVRDSDRRGNQFRNRAQRPRDGPQRHNGRKQITLQSARAAPIRSIQRDMPTLPVASTVSNVQTPVVFRAYTRSPSTELWTCARP